MCVFAQVKYHETRGHWQNVCLPKIHIELLLQTHRCAKEKVLVKLPRESWNITAGKKYHHIFLQPWNRIFLQPWNQIGEVSSSSCCY